MKSDHLSEGAPEERRRYLLANVALILPAMYRHAAVLDGNPQFPSTEFEQLRAAGALSAPLPVRLGGLGLGLEPEGTATLLELLRLLGRGNLVVGRIFEGHVNALKLLTLYGGENQARAAAKDTGDGHLYAVWNTEGNDPVRIGGEHSPTLMGSKSFCSAAGHASRAVITAASQDGMHMLLVSLSGAERSEPTEWALHGMRASVTGSVRFDNMPIAQSNYVGGPGDYLREPAFSAGAWRTIAVTFGGLEALIDEVRTQLVAKKRQNDPHQLARMGRAFIGRETARLWVQKAALMAEISNLPPPEVTAYVNLARCAVEAAVLETIQIVQRSLGLAAFVQPNPIERLMRDLGVYLRQPAPDEALTEASAWLIDNSFSEDRWK